MRRTACPKLRNVSRLALMSGGALLTGPLGQHAVRGATKEKSRKLDELKAKRREKDEKKRVRIDPSGVSASSYALLDADKLSQTCSLVIPCGHGHL